jgi:hypothetical protein
MSGDREKARADLDAALRRCPEVVLRVIRGSSVRRLSAAQARRIMGASSAHRTSRPRTSCDAAHVDGYGAIR